MGKAGKNRRKLARKERKQAIKRANQERYQAMAKLGENKKSKRFKKRMKKKLVSMYDTHPTNCGNVGCKRCFPENISRKVSSTMSLNQYKKLI